MRWLLRHTSTVASLDALADSQALMISAIGCWLLELVLGAGAAGGSEANDINLASGYVCGVLHPNDALFMFALGNLSSSFILSLFSAFFSFFSLFGVSRGLSPVWGLALYPVRAQEVDQQDRPAS